MDFLTKSIIRIAASVVIALTVSACGGGSSGPLGPSTGSFDASGGGVLGDADNVALQGGVLATFLVGGEQFSGWFVDGINADLLVDAFSGAGAPISTICTQVLPGSGRGAHNDPWQWSVSPRDFLTVFNAQSCTSPVCFSPYRSPSQIENSLVGDTFSCKPAPSQETGLTPPATYAAFMQVALIDVQDFR